MPAGRWSKKIIIRTTILYHVQKVLLIIDTWETIQGELMIALIFKPIHKSLILIYMKKQGTGETLSVGGKEDKAKDIQLSA